MASTHFFSLPIFLLFCIISSLENHKTAVARLAKPGCKDTCGSVRIPYPFGMAPGCAINGSYTITCSPSSSSSSSKPYLTELNLEVLNISLRNQTVTVNAPIDHPCTRTSPEIMTATGSATWSSSNLAGTPFFFSAEHNMMMLFGCGHVALSQENILTGCTSTCEWDNAGGKLCNGVGCCEATIPFYLTHYRLNFTVSRYNTRNCSSAFLADENWRVPADLSGSSAPSVPLVLEWTLGEDDIQEAHPCPYWEERRLLELESGQTVTTFMCSTCDDYLPTLNSSLLEINPYLQDFSCGNDFIQIRGNKLRAAAILGVAPGLGSLFLIASIFTVYKKLKKRRERKIKQKYFKRNGGLLLQQQLSADEGTTIEKTRIFTAKELDKASDRFNANLILGQGGQGTVYKGLLTDGRIVAIKKSKKVDECQSGQFINEVVILSQVNHRNVVQLLGCCLETEVPLLVYEFIPNGTLYSLIHNQNEDEFPFTWNLRLRIATEVAEALAYLHSAISIPIYHRDIKSSNILLDEKYIAKVSDFGTSRSVAIDKTHLTTLVQGTFGYLDPEYFQSSQFTEKSDVYSFGVVLVELLTRKKPISPGTEEDSHLNLATSFLACMDENGLDRILDPQVLDKSNKEEVIAVAKLAQSCLNLNGKKRPTMKEVAIELESIKVSATRSTVEKSFPRPGLFIKGESESLQFSDIKPSWTTETDSIRSNSVASSLSTDTSSI